MILLVAGLVICFAYSGSNYSEVAIEIACWLMVSGLVVMLSIFSFHLGNGMKKR